MVIRNLEITDRKVLKVENHLCFVRHLEIEISIRVSSQFFLLVTLHVILWVNQMKSCLYYCMSVFSSHCILAVGLQGQEVKKSLGYKSYCNLLMKLPNGKYQTLLKYQCLWFCKVGH